MKDLNSLFVLFLLLAPLAPLVSAYLSPLCPPFGGLRGGKVSNPQDRRLPTSNR